MIAYLQHGKPPGPFLTERVAIKKKPLYWKQNGSFGKKVATQYMVFFRNKWRRVYECRVGISSSAFIGSADNWDAAVTLSEI